MRAGLLHYTAPPVTGGVEAVMQAHAAELAKAGVRTLVLAGRGDAQALPKGVELTLIERMDTQDMEILKAGAALQRGVTPANFFALVDDLTQRLRAALAPDDVVFVHNVFSKHFNLALTAALFNLMEAGAACRWVAWNHDLSWTSANSRPNLHEGHPWDLLRTRHARMIPVTVSKQRQAEMAELYGIPKQAVKVIYNGVDPQALLGFSPEGAALVERLDLFGGDLNLLMPVRVTQAKNIELALRVMAELVRRGLNPRLVVTGPPDPHDAGSMAYYEQLRSLRDTLELKQKMRFVYEMGVEPGESLTIDARTVGELYRASDARFMPSHREGFGMPVLEAGLAGLAVFCTQAAPAGPELAGDEAIFFGANDSPESVAVCILEWMRQDPTTALRRRVRQVYTWKSIFERDMLPLLEGNCPA